MRVLRYLILLLLLNPAGLKSQERDYSERPFAKYASWLLLQTIPSPTISGDADDNNARLQFSLRWQITPVNVSFRANRFVSPVQFFMINPVRRVTGSAEIFVQPELALSSYKYSGFDRFGINTGARVIIPVQELGENISVSLGGKYTFRKNVIIGDNGYPGIEAGVYFTGGLFGLQFTKNFNKNSPYSISFYLKYF